MLTRKIEIHHLLCGLIVASMCVLGIASSAANVDIAIIMMLAALLIWFVRYKREVLLKYCVFLISGIWSIIDVFLLENTQMWVPNLQEYSSHSGALFLISFSFTVFIISLAIFDRRYTIRVCRPDPKEPTSKFSDKVYFLVVVVSFIILLGFVFDAVTSGYFASGSSSRYEFLSNADSISSSYYYYLQMIIPVIAIYARRKNAPLIMYLFAGLFLICLLLLGNKFGALMNIVYVCILSFYFAKDRTKAQIDKDAGRALLLLVCFAGVLSIYSLIQMFYEHNNLTDAITQFVNRIFSGQGDLWWGMYAQYGSLVPQLSSIMDELQAFDTDGLSQIQYNFGVYKMMNLVAPQSVLDTYALLGIRFTSSTDASLFYYFGSVGLIVGKVMIAWVLTLLVNALIKASKLDRGFEAFFITVILFFALRAASMSEFYLFLTTTSVLCYFALFVSKVLRQKACKESAPQSATLPEG